MLLTRDDFAAWAINWDPKPDNIRKVAADLDLGMKMLPEVLLRRGRFVRANVPPAPKSRQVRLQAR